MITKYHKMAIMVKIGQMIILAAKLDMCHKLYHAIDVGGQQNIAFANFIKVDFSRMMA